MQLRSSIRRLKNVQDSGKELLKLLQADLEVVINVCDSPPLKQRRRKTRQISICHSTHTQTAAHNSTNLRFQVLTVLDGSACCNRFWSVERGIHDEFNRRAGSSVCMRNEKCEGKYKIYKRESAQLWRRRVHEFVRCEHVFDTFGLWSRLN